MYSKLISKILEVTPELAQKVPELRGLQGQCVPVKITIPSKNTVKMLMHYCKSLLPQIKDFLSKKYDESYASDVMVDYQNLIAFGFKHVVREVTVSEPYPHKRNAIFIESGEDNLWTVEDMPYEILYEFINFVQVHWAERGLEWRETENYLELKKH